MGWLILEAGAWGDRGWTRGLVVAGGEDERRRRIFIFIRASEHGVYGMDWIWRRKEAVNEI